MDGSQDIAHSVSHLRARRKIKQSLRTIGPRYSSRRMLEDYLATAYRVAAPAAAAAGA